MLESCDGQMVVVIDSMLQGVHSFSVGFRALRKAYTQVDSMIIWHGDLSRLELEAKSFAAKGCHGR